MVRVEKMEHTPKQRPSEWADSGSKEATTKSGRKVKRPTHLDSPERSPDSPIPDGRKDGARKVKKTTEIVDSPAKGTPKRGALTKADETADDVKGSSRKTKGSTRKTIATLTGTPKKVEVDTKKLPDAVDDGGISKSGRKIKVPAKLIDFESEILTSPRKVVGGAEEQTLASAKTPGQRPSRSVQHAADEPVRNRAGRGRSVAAKEGGSSPPRKGAVTADYDAETPPSRTVSPSPAPPKTPGRRAKSVAPAQKAEESSGTPKTTRTPGRRAKSVAPAKAEVKTAQKAEESSGTPKTTRTPGRRAKSVAPAKAEVKTAQQTEANSGTPKSTRKPGRPVVMKMRASSPEVTLSGLGRQTAQPKPPAESEELKENANDASVTGRTPGRALMKKHVDSPAVSVNPSLRLGRSLAPTRAAAESAEAPEREATRGGKTPGRTPGRRAVKSLMPSIPIPSGADEQDDPKPSNSSTAGIVERSGASVESLSRSGRKLKQKKMFEIEQEESSNQKQHSDDGTDPITAGGRKRKLDNVDDSPRKKITTEKVALPAKEQEQSSSQTGLKPEVRALALITPLVLKKPAKKTEISSDVSVVTNTASNVVDPQAGEAEGLVSRSGRKIKLKKMFDFNDGGDASDASVCHVTSPSKAATTGTTSARIAKEKLATKAESTDGPSPVDKFVTKRGVDDHHHHHPKRQVVAVDEPDRAVQLDVKIPDIIVSSPPIVKTPPPMADNVVEPVAVSTSPADPRADSSSEASGSRRSGRKIKQKKFFGDDDGVAANESFGQANRSGTTEDGNKSTSVAPVVAALSATVNRDQQVDADCPSTQSPTEEQTNEDDAHSTVDDQGEQENVADTDKGPGVDIAEGVDPAQPALSKQEGMDVAEGSTEPAVTEQPDREDNLLSNVGTTLPAGPSDSNATYNLSRQSEGSVHSAGASESPADGEKDVSGNDASRNAGRTAVEDNGAVLEAATATEQQKHTDEAVVAAVEPPMAVGEGETNSLLSPDKLARSDPRKHNLSGESTIEKLVVDDDDDLLADGSYGEIEFLEDDEPDVVEHIRKPTSRAASEEMRAAAVVPSIKITQCPSTPGATAPRTPGSKAAAGRNAVSKCSPDKPPEIIEILDSPAAMAFCQQIDDATGTGTAAGGGGSATSTPLPAKPLTVGEAALRMEGVVGKLVHEGRKRSLSASAADTTMKRNVTFHSPANSTVLVDAIDERLMMKSNKSATKGSGPRKRSLSEHKPPSHEGPKPNKISRKVPNFKTIHANHFDRMESIAEFMKRKEQRAKVILTAASPATKLLSRPAGAAAAVADVGKSTEKKAATQKPFVFKSGGGSVALFGKAASNSTVGPKQPKASHIARPVLTAATRAAAMAAKLKGTNPDQASDGRMANRLLLFKPKQHAPDGPTAMDATSSTQRPVEQLRSKQSKILKGVRTNRRFELQMKHRDHLQHP